MRGRNIYNNPNSYKINSNKLKEKNRDLLSNAIIQTINCALEKLPKRTQERKSKPNVNQVGESKQKQHQRGTGSQLECEGGFTGMYLSSRNL